MKRDAIETDLTFEGLIIFRNELRPDSAETIAALKVRQKKRRGGGCVLRVRPGCGRARLFSRPPAGMCMAMRCTSF
jgi:hypothetical protein